MATVTTSTANTAFSQAFGYPPTQMMDVSPITGHLWLLCRTTGTTVGIFKSTDNGGSWSLAGSFTRTDLQDLCAMRIDSRGESIHVAYFVTDTVDRVYYKRIPISTGTPGSSGEVLWSNGGGTSTPQSFLISADLVPISHPDGSFTVVLARTAHGPTTGATMYAITVRNDAARTTLNNNGLLVSTRSYQTTGDDIGCTLSLDVEHNGDGITSSTPNVWMAWQVFDKIYCVKAVFQGYKTGWTTPKTAYTVATGRTTVRDVPSRWDGTRYLITSPRPSSTSQMDIYERPVSNTGSSITRTSPAHPVGALGANTIATNHVNRDFRIYAVSGSSTIRYVDYFRASNTWGSWTQVSATVPLTSEWGARRTTAYLGQYDVYKESGGGSPWTVTNDVLAVTFAPNAPTWITGTAGTIPYDGSAWDVSQSLLLDGKFNDPNASDTQGSYALSRQVGAGTIQYWRASDSTWQAAEVQNASASTQLTLTTAQWLGGGGAADPAHTYRVKTWDAGGLASSYSSTLSVIPSTRVDPTLTAPAVGAILNTGQVGVTWTVTEQSQYRVRMLPALVTDTFTRTVSNGWGDSEYGGAWTITGATPNSDYSVSSGSGRHAHPASNITKETSLAGILADNLNMLALGIFASAAPTGGNAEWGLRCRYVDANNFVHARVYFQVGTAPSVIVASISGGVETHAGFVTVSGIPTAGPVNLRFVAEGDMLYARIWQTGQPEPAEWNTTLTATHFAAGWVTVRTFLPSANSNTKPYTLGVGDLIVNDSSLITHDSGFQADPIPLSPTVLDYTVPVTLPDGYAGVVQLTTKNAEGLSSVTQVAPFSVDFVEPVAPVVSALTAAPASGGINVTVTAGAPSGAQPTTARMDIYRRVAAYTVPTNTNPYFETNTTDWTNNGYATIARSTAQFHQGVASLLMTPNGSSATPKAQTTAIYPTTVGAQWEWRGWLRPTTANKTIRLYLEWCDVSTAVIGSTTRDVTPVAGVWLWAWMRGTAPSGTAGVRFAVGQLATPAAGDTMYGDEMVLIQTNGDDGLRIETQAVSGQTYLDWRAVTGVNYEYRGYAESGNGTSVWGPWSS